MAARKNPPPQPVIDADPDVETPDAAVVADDSEGDGPEATELTDPDVDVDVDVEPNDPDETAADVGPPGYMFVTRRKPVQIGAPNPQWVAPVLIDEKSLPELQAQGWRPVEQK